MGGKPSHGEIMGPGTVSSYGRKVNQMLEEPIIKDLGFRQVPSPELQRLGDQAGKLDTGEVGTKVGVELARNLTA